MANPSEKSTAPDQQGPGAQLRRARERRGLTQREVAEELHVDLWMVDALERDDFETLGAPVFAKGHMRKYATIVGIPVDELLVAYYRVRGQEQSPPLVADSLVTRERPRKRGTPATLVVLGLIAALAAVAAIAWFALGNRPVAGTAPADAQPVDTADTEPVTQQAPAQEPPLEIFQPLPATDPEGRTDATDTAEDASPASTEADTPEAPADAAEVPATAEPPPPEPAPVALPDGVTEIRLRFSEDSWVEVYDAQRNRLLYGMGNAGSTETLRGPRPIQVFLGRQHAVDVEVDGAPYEVPAEARRGNIARFVIE